MGANYLGFCHTHNFLGRRVPASIVFDVELAPEPMICLSSMQWCVVNDVFVLVEIVTSEKKICVHTTHPSSLNTPRGETGYLEC